MWYTTRLPKEPRFKLYGTEQPMLPQLSCRMGGMPCQAAMDRDSEAGCARRGILPEPRIGDESTWGAEMIRRDK